MRRRGQECFAREVRGEQCDAAWAAVFQGDRHRLTQIGFRGQILDRVVNQHRVERPPQPQRAHVALDALALRIRTLTNREHAGERSTSVAWTARL